MDDPLHRGQADAEPSAFFGAGKALEWGKEIARVRHIDDEPFGE
jgi:hypothetical protein